MTTAPHASLTSVLRLVGFTLMGLGVGGALYMLAKMNELGLSDERAVLFALSLAFAHLVAGSLCRAMGAALNNLRLLQLAQPRAVASASTICGKCCKTFAGDLRGQFCDECGTSL